MKLPNIKNKVFFIASFAFGYIAGMTGKGIKGLFIAILFMLADYFVILVLIPLAWKQYKKSGDKDLNAEKLGEIFNLK